MIYYISVKPNALYILRALIVHLNANTQARLTFLFPPLYTVYMFALMTLFICFIVTQKAHLTFLIFHPWFCFSQQQVRGVYKKLVENYVALRNPLGKEW